MNIEEKNILMNREYVTYKKDKKVIQKPRYLHDCLRCKFFGHYGRFDLWACVTEQEYPKPAIIHTLIARYGEDGDYASGNPFIAMNKQIYECFCRVYDFYCEGRIILEYMENYRDLLRVIRDGNRVWKPIQDKKRTNSIYCC